MRGLVIPDPTEDFTADPVELFFDLAFVLAFSQLVSHLIHHPTWTGAAESMLLFLILWFAWSVFTWSANAVQGNSRQVRAIFLVATATSVPMGASITTAFGPGGGTFAVCGAVIVMMALALQIWGLETGSNEYRTAVNFAIPSVLVCAFLVVGGFVDGDLRTVFWVLFVLGTIAMTASASSGDWFVRSGHFAERHGLIIIIALGEVIVAIGISVVSSLSDNEGLSNPTLWGLIAAGILAVLLWWSYFDRVLPALEHRGEGLAGPDRGRYTRDAYTWLHAPIVAGVITAAAATEEILLHPKDEVHTEFLIMFVAGLALFYFGIAGAVRRAYPVIAKERIAAVIAIAALAYFGRSLDGVTFLLIVDAVLLLGLLAEHLRIEAPSHQPEHVTADA